MTGSVEIASVMADEIIDSRGNPTLRTTVVLADGTTGSASVPSGTSTGQFEAVELRDGDTGRYDGRGVLRAVSNVNGPIAQALIGLQPDDQWRIDATLIAVDGSEYKKRLGSNAILSASLACAQAAARACELPLFRYLGGDAAHVLPVPMLNVLNGGRHAHGGPDIQEFMVVPVGASTFGEALRYAVETYHALREVLCEAGMRANTGDEGGFVPTNATNERAVEMLVRAIERAGYRPADDIAIALDVSASSLLKNETYAFAAEGASLSADDMIECLAGWRRRYPIISVEDPLADSDWSGFARLTARLGDTMQVVGDDLFVSNRMFLVRGIAQRCCNAVLIKPNQVGTVTETLDTARMAISVGYGAPVSHRSGDTLDTSIADLAVALNCGQIKAGAPARGERVAKYNRLLEIEKWLGAHAEYAGRGAFAHLKSP
ncbi:phosphopyruvate hydratase [Paraburkholderia terrae]|uniref:phosphopyruvate hydratase n=1 Tax=Paraburkholderia terrae TaxID=311230 RepID=UPI00296B0C15|nr:phosphopyruvate hydratase [Paraburkholderia terrae]MDW3660673.1 phosphopyruvate hydratase [Paraburkholderia terrae]